MQDAIRHNRLLRPNTAATDRRLPMGPGRAEVCGAAAQPAAFDAYSPGFSAVDTFRSKTDEHN